MRGNVDHFSKHICRQDMNFIKKKKTPRNTSESLLNINPTECNGLSTKSNMKKGWKQKEKYSQTTIRSKSIRNTRQSHERAQSNSSTTQMPWHECSISSSPSTHLQIFLCDSFSISTHADTMKSRDNDRSAFSSSICKTRLPQRNTTINKKPPKASTGLRNRKLKKKNPNKCRNKWE